MLTWLASVKPSGTRRMLGIRFATPITRPRAWWTSLLSREIGVSDGTGATTVSAILITGARRQRRLPTDDKDTSPSLVAGDSDLAVVIVGSGRRLAASVRSLVRG
jgi:hypothetical protein